MDVTKITNDCEDARAGNGRRRHDKRTRTVLLECHLPDDGVLLSPDVEVFRGGSGEGYPFWQNPACLTAVVLLLVRFTKTMSQS